MCGSATLAMLVSSTSMNVARVTVMAMAHGLYRGRQGVGGAVVRGSAVVLILFEQRASPTCPDATCAPGSGRDRTRCAPECAAPLSRNFRSRFPEAGG